MRRKIQPRQFIAAAIIACSLLPAGTSRVVQAETANGPSLVISQLKLTSGNGQFITLYNATDTSLDMSKYRLEYFNNYDLTKATSSRMLTLSGTVPPHGYYMVNDSSLLLCYRLTIDSQSLGLSTTAGLVQVLSISQTKAGGSVVSVLQDFVAWSKTAVNGAVTLPANNNVFLQRQPTDANNNPFVSIAGSGNWQQVQPDNANICNLISVTAAPTIIPTGLNQLLPSTEPPFTILTLPVNDADQIAAPVLPASDIGLMAPQINELLPNPVGTGNDDTDEFVELYNPNPVSFDLSGFSFQVGLTASRTYKFPSGTMLPATSFTAFYSADTGLNLSNSGGQVKLLDPFGNSISATQAYATAKDGQSWALAKGSWYWTTKTTPGVANIIAVPPAKKSAKSTTKKTVSAKPVAIHAAKKPSHTNLGSDLAEITESSPVHPAVLALVPGLALLYGAYEYRADLANRIHQFRSYRRIRRADRTSPERR